MPNSRTRFSFRISGVSRIVICFSVVVSSLLLFYPVKSHASLLDMIRNKIDDHIYTDSLRWTVDKYIRGSINITDVKELPDQHLEVYGSFAHRTFKFGAQKNFKCTVKRILDDVSVTSCCWHEPAYNSEWCTQREGGIN